MSEKYNVDEIIKDFLTHDLNQSELSKYYAGKGITISSQTISKILNRTGLPEDLKEAIREKKRELEYRNSKLTMEELNKLFTTMDVELPLLVKHKMYIKEHENLLRVVYLYVSGKSFEEIRDILGYSKSTISSWINKVLDMDILKDHVINIIKNRLDSALKFNNSALATDILRVVNIFIKNNGDYTATMEEGKVSERTLTRYLSYDILEDLMGTVNYNHLQQLKENLIKKQTKEAALKFAKNEKIREGLLSCHVEGIRVKRYKLLLKYILIDNVYSVYKLQEMMDISVDTIIKYLKDKDTILSLFGQYVFDSFILVEEKIDGLNEPQLDNNCILIDYYLRSRYDFKAFAEKFDMSENSLKKLLKEEIVNYKAVFGDDIQDRVNEHIQDVKTLKLRCARNMRMVDGAELIDIADPNLLYVDDMQYKRLIYCVLCFKYNGDISLLCEKENLIYSIVYTELKNQKTLSLLNNDAREKINLYMYYEDIIKQSVNMSTKKDLVIKTIQCFCLQGFDVKSVIKELELPIEILKKIVNDPLCDALYIKEVMNTIRHEVNCYQAYQQEKMTGKRK